MLLLSLLSLALVFLLLGLGFLSCSLHIWKVYFRRDLTLACCNIPFYKKDKSIKIKKRRQKSFFAKISRLYRHDIEESHIFLFESTFSPVTPCSFSIERGEIKDSSAKRASCPQYITSFKSFLKFKISSLSVWGRLMFARRANFHFLLRGSPLWMVWLTWNYFFQISLRPLLGLIMLSTHSLKRIVDASFIGRRICNCLQGGNLALSWIFF